MNSRDHRNWRVIRQLRQEADNRPLVALGLKDFETIDECVSRNRQMLARFQRTGMPPDLWQKFYGSPLERQENGFDGDWIASRGHRATLLPQAHRLMTAHCGPLHFVTVVHPNWELPVANLSKADIGAARQWLHRRFQRLDRSVLVVGGFEASLRVELNSGMYWAGHLHLVVAGAENEELRGALEIERRYITRKYARPVTVEPIGDLARRLGYSTKRLGRQNIAYIGKNGRQQRRELPLPTQRQVEFDLWLPTSPWETS